MSTTKNLLFENNDDDVDFNPDELVKHDQDEALSLRDMKIQIPLLDSCSVSQVNET